jgi:alkyl sulfatase BDS1-like metallo-beta-lactamase superfamily hydrolase
VIKAADGRVVYDTDVYTAATAGDCPDTVNPSLWRQSQLTAIQGLFEVTEGIYQLRGIELSNMTVVEGEAGVIVIDPAVSAAGLALYREQRHCWACSAVRGPTVSSSTATRRSSR